MNRKAPARWKQNPGLHRVIHCPDMSCGAPMKVPAPPTTEPTPVTCDGTFPHTWNHRALTVGEGS